MVDFTLFLLTDLKTMSERLKSRYYMTRKLFMADMQRIFTNCREYNPPESEYYKCANLLEKFFERPPPTVNTFGREHKMYFTHARLLAGTGDDQSIKVKIEVEEEGMEVPLPISRSNLARSRTRVEDRVQRGSTDRSKVRARELHGS